MAVPPTAAANPYAPGGNPPKIRTPGMVALLVIVTFGIYGLVWLFLAFKEVNSYNRQEHPTALYIVGLIFGIVLLVYVATEMGKLRRAKQQIGLPGGMGGGATVGLLIGGAFVGIVLFIIVFIGGMALSGGEPSAGAELGIELLASLFLLIVGGIIYAVLQGQVNNYWTGVRRKTRTALPRGAPA